MGGRCPSSQTGADEVELAASYEPKHMRKVYHLIRHGLA